MKKFNLKKLVAQVKNRKQRRFLIFFLVKLGLSNKPVAQKIIKARTIIANMTGNAYFPTTNPPIANLTTVTDALETAEAALDGSKIKTEQRDMALAAFEAVIKQLQSDVENIADGNVEKILSSGFDVRNPRTAPVILPAPVALTAVSTGISGQVKIRWQAVKGAKSYPVQVSADGGANWTMAAASTKATVIVEELTPGQLFFFRVACFNAAGLSGWSDPIQCRPN